MKSVSSHSTKLYCRIALFCISKTSWSNWYSKESFIKSSYGLIFIFFKALNTLRQKVNFKCLYKVARKVELDKKIHQNTTKDLTIHFWPPSFLWKKSYGKTWLGTLGCQYLEVVGKVKFRATGLLLWPISFTIYQGFKCSFWAL